LKRVREIRETAAHPERFAAVLAIADAVIE
jgi:hypothetical protein